jgi:hypothetical protein
MMTYCARNPLFTLWGTFDGSISLIAYRLIQVRKAAFGNFNTVVMVADFNRVEGRPNRRGSMGTASGSMGKRRGALL